MKVAASPRIYIWAMPEGSIQVTIHESLGTPNPWLLIPAFKLLAVTHEPIHLPYCMACKYLKKEERKPFL